MSDEELFAVDGDKMGNGAENDGFEDVLTSEERNQFDSTLRMGNSDGGVKDEKNNVNDHHFLINYLIEII